MFATDLLQFALNGLVTGCFYALMALGLSLVFGLMNIVNFAHGALFVLGGMLASEATNRLGLPFWAAVPCVLVVMWVAGVVIEGGLLARMRDAHILPVTLVTIGLSVFLVNTMLMVFGTEPKNVETGLSGPPFFLGDVILSQSRVLAIVVSGVAILATWVLIALMIGSGLATLISTSRAGIDLIWGPSDMPQPALRVSEAVPVGLLLVVCLGLMVFAGPVMRYMERAGQSLGDRQGYVQAVLGASRIAAQEGRP